MKPRSVAAMRKSELAFDMTRSSSTNRRPNLRSALGLMSGTSLDGIDVTAVFRSGVVAAVRARAPLAPRYPAAFPTEPPKPAAVLNAGGVANVTCVGEGPDEIRAFDTGPRNALIDDWVRRHTGRAA